MIEIRAGEDASWPQAHQFSGASDGQSAHAPIEVVAGAADAVQELTLFEMESILSASDPGAWDEARAPYQARSTLGRSLQALVDAGGYEAGLEKFGRELAGNPETGHRRFFYEEIFHRHPENYDAAMAEVHSVPEILRDFLGSDEFVYRHNALLLEEFSRLGRDLIIHVPKSGGTTLLNGYQESPKYATLADDAYVLANCSDRLDYYRGRVEDLSRVDAERVVITGHVRAAFILDNRLKRAGDMVYSILRDPVDSALSFVNYILTELLSESGHAENNNRRAILGLARGESIEDLERMQGVAHDIIDRLMPSQNLCSMFTPYDKFDAAVDAIAILDVNFIRINQLDAFMREKGLPSGRRDNVSKRYLKFDDLGRNTKLLLFEKIGEDLKLCKWLDRNSIQSSDTCFRMK